MAEARPRSSPPAGGARALLAILVLLAAAPLAGTEAWFTEVSSAWGVDFEHRNGASGEFFMPETMGSGVVAVDYDLDGDPDLFFVDSGTLGTENAPGQSRLLRNDGGGRFVDVTDFAGLSVSGYGMGAVAGDVDGDGDPDLYVSAFGADQLFENRGDGTFADVTEKAGLGNPDWGASAAFADTDLDGDLDLYVTNYVDFTVENNRICGAVTRGLRSYCHPDVYDGVLDRYYENRGDGTFVDRTAEAGFSGATGKGLGVTFADFDDDGLPDLYVANDMTANFLYRNEGEGKFVETGLMAGVAFDPRGSPEAGMGVGAGDLDGDGRTDLVVTHLDHQTNALYANQGGGLFLDRRARSGLAAPSLMKVGFGVALADLDLDGDLDALVANGHIIHNVHEWDSGSTYRQANQLYENLGGGRFREVAAAGLEVVRSSRGLAIADLDGDRDLDVVVSNSNEAAEVYRNDRGAGEALVVELVGAAAIGARVELRTGPSVESREVRAGASYLSQHQGLAVFGAVSAEGARRLRIVWPGGRTLTLSYPTPGLGYRFELPAQPR